MPLTDAPAPAPAFGIPPAPSPAHAAAVPAVGAPKIGPPATIETFAFGDPEPVLDRSEVLPFLEARVRGAWYEPPVSTAGLVRAFDMPGPHSSCIRLKVNLLVAHFEPTPALSRADFRRFALDFVVLGNAYLERRRNALGGTLAMRHALGRYVRRGVEDGRYFFVTDIRRSHEFEPGSIVHLLLEHPTQEIYGLPEYFAGLQSGFLGEAATLFRRKYYLNGNHAGFVFFVGSDKIDAASADAIKESLKRSKGPGNFRSIFLHAPGAHHESVKVIPIGEAGAKDDFLNIKRVTRDEVLAIHRTPPPLVAIVPENTGGFGDPAKAMDVYFHNEIEPVMGRLLEVNDMIGEELVRFAPYRGAQPAGAQ